jgi:hypothetical protein
MTAAAFCKGLLDLEGTSLAPILISLVTKDAKMLDAFEKGASADIQKVSCPCRSRGVRLLLSG